MAKITEKRLYAVPSQLLISDGTSVGQLTVANSSLYVVGHIIVLSSSTQPPLRLKIKRIINSTTMFVGEEKTPIQQKTDISAYLVADGAAISAEEQNRPSIPEQEIERATYEEEPVIARRTILVDEFGNRYNNTNPLPTTAVISGDVTIGTDGFDLTNPDSVQLTGSIDGAETSVKYGFVNNLRLQILATHDRVQNLSYADFGTKDQRVTQIDYSSAQIVGYTARKTITYTLVGNKYRRDSINWSIV